MDFKHLRTFQTAAQTLNFSETAEMLGYVQSAVTAHIRSLESELEVRLFDRNGRGVRLTYEGQQLLDYADRLFALRDEAEQAIKRGKDITGNITIAGYESLLTYRLPQILKRFVDAYPQVRLNVVPLAVKQLKTQVLNAQIDIAFTMEQSTHVNGLEQLRLRCEEVNVIAAPSHPLAKKKCVTANDLVNETLLFTEPGCSYRALFEHNLMKAGVFDKPKLEFVSVEPIKACVKMGMGIAALSRVSTERDIAQGRLAKLDWQGDDLSVNLHMVWNSKRWLSPAVKAFLDVTQSFYDGSELV
ncbi:HTH-type transcriptional regulator YofA [BD1-7 clade bacterium]|uniref:HTH-type transcriptional regulator YofA n=1 Tax=BD1-7 clade bacterium TaxID=2029982 RepID=A0A5S9QNM2_9GAMM|nr:HTH-type transcriptional regulator YofA [BD1-7 clade bacterium]